MNSLLADHRLSMVFGAVMAVTAVTAAVYVAFGPATKESHHRFRRHRLTKNGKNSSRSRPRGLYNCGNTCFVNAVLQAAASCTSLMSFLGKLRQMRLDAEADFESEKNRTKKTLLLSSLLDVLAVVNGQDVEENDEAGDPEVWAPASLFRALRGYGWVINSDEQDAQEFFQVLFSALEEELQLQKPQRTDSLLDSNAVAPGDLEKNGTEVEMAEEQKEGPQVRKRRISSSSGVLHRSGTELSLKLVQRQTKLCFSMSTPFTGTLTSKLIFKQSGKSKSPTSSTVFNNITLNLPSLELRKGGWMAPVIGLGNPPVTLQTMLQMFVSLELVEGSGASQEEGAEGLVKQLTFGRLPECLCFHVQRTAYENGTPFKRNDVVLFPTVLNMDNYAYNRNIVKHNATSWSMPDCSVASTVTQSQEADSHLLPSPTETMSFSDSVSHQNNYSLRAVVVHLGGIDSGHYITYRRESENPLVGESASQWFYTSDSLIKEVAVDEVLKANPYMLFYEKIHSVPTACKDAQPSAAETKTSGEE